MLGPQELVKHAAIKRRPAPSGPTGRGTTGTPSPGTVFLRKEHQVAILVFY